MSVARRPLLTAVVAGLLLCALWFVPSANATAESGGAAERQRAGAVAAPQELRFADMGGLDTVPYLIGGTAFLVLGVAFVAYAVRRPSGPTS